MNDTCFIVCDKNGQGLGYFYFEAESGRRGNQVLPVTGETVIGRDENGLGKREFHQLNKFKSEKTYPSHVDDYCKT